MKSANRTPMFMIKAALVGGVSVLALGSLVWGFSGDTAPNSDELAKQEASQSPITTSSAQTVAEIESAAGKLKLETDLMTSEYQAVGAIPDPSASLKSLEIEKTVTVAPGDTLMKLLVDAGATRGEAHNAITALSEVYSPRKIRPGLDIALLFDPPQVGESSDEAREVGPLKQLQFQPSVERIVKVVNDAEQQRYLAEEIERPLEMQLAYRSHRIDSSLYLAATEANVPNAALIDMIRTYSFDVDFQREIQSGDAFEVIYEAYYDEDGKLAKTGEMLYGKLTLSGVELPLYRFTPSSGFTDYFNEKGQSVRKALMRTPIDGARLSSRFGRRKHPVLGYTKMHKGIDFAAPRGTPIYAAGDGTVERASRWSSFGNYIRIRHHSGYKTAYAHLKGFAKGVRKGKRVRQGQVIGYVGTTGRSTGPHLHYEVHYNGKQVNPLGVKLPAGETLKKADLKKFQAERARIDALRTRLAKPAVVAALEGKTEDGQSAQ